MKKKISIKLTEKFIEAIDIEICDGDVANAYQVLKRANLSAPQIKRLISMLSFKAMLKLWAYMELENE